MLTGSRLAGPSQSERSCPDCPAMRRGLLDGLVKGSASGRCMLHSHVLEARRTLPSVLSERYAFAIVRRGWVMRSRIDGRGNHTAVDVAGAGALVPLQSSHGGAVPSVFAATRALLCFCPESAIDPATTDSRVAFDIVRLHQEALERVERIADARGREGALEKVAALLATLAELRSSQSDPRKLPDGLQQRDVAALLQIRPETVCRALRALDNESRPAP